MRPQIVWALMISAVAVLVWQLHTPEAVIGGVAAGLLLLLLGILAGLRIATDSLTNLMKDLVMLNKYLAEQNQDLSEMNQMLLKEVAIPEDEPEPAHSEQE